MDILIPLTPIELKRYAIIGIEDRDLALDKWFSSGPNSIYARKSDSTKSFMHRIIMQRVIGRDLTTDEHIDHIDNNGLNNRRSNLRIATFYQNQLNKKGRGTSKFRGVSFNTESEKWAVQIHFDNISTHLGLYENEIIAAQIYDAAAREYLDSRFVRFNFPDKIFRLSDFGISIDIKSGRPKITTRLSQVGYRGVEYISNKYRAKISVNNKTIHLGLYNSPIEAAQIYDKYAKLYHRNNAVLNFP